MIVTKTVVRDSNRDLKPQFIGPMWGTSVQGAHLSKLSPYRIIVLSASILQTPIDPFLDCGWKEPARDSQPKEKKEKPMADDVMIDLIKVKGKKEEKLWWKNKT